MENEYDLSGLSPAEYEKIASVLRRDRKLRLLEEARITQLKRDLVYLRKRAALRPGMNADRCCARCLELLGRILNRGALCPLCLKKVCKSCRRFSPPVALWNSSNVPSNNVSSLAVLQDRSPEHEWLCVVCHKRMELKAVSGEWMEEYNNVCSQKKAKTSPGDQIRKVLHENQRQSLLSNSGCGEKSASAFNLTIVGQPPPKPPRTFAYHENKVPQIEDTSHINKNDDHKKIPKSTKESMTEVMSSVNKVKVESKGMAMAGNVSPRPVPRVSPWSGIEAEPRIPARSLRAASFGHLMSIDCADPWVSRDKDSMDDANSMASLRSRSTSSDVMDELEHRSLPRRLASPLKKQEVIPEPPIVIDNQQSSSLDTTDSGVFSPGIKNEDTLPGKSNSLRSPLKSAKSECGSSKIFDQIDSPETPESPLTSRKSESDAHYSSETSDAPGIKFPPHLTKSEASSSEPDSPKLAKKVVFKKKKQTSRKELSRKFERKFWNKEEHRTSIDRTTHITQSGLTNPVTTFNNTFLKAKNNRFSNKTNLSSSCHCSSYTMPSLGNNNNDGKLDLHESHKLSKKHGVSKSVYSFVINNEAVSNVVDEERHVRDAGKSADDPPGEEVKSSVVICQSSTRSNCLHKSHHTLNVALDEEKSCHNKSLAKSIIGNSGDKYIYNSADVLHPRKCHVSLNVRCSRPKSRVLITPNFCRSTSVPSYRMASPVFDKYSRSLLRSHSLDGWLRYFEDTLYGVEKSTVSKCCRAMNEVLPDDYKLVFVDSDVDWSESDARESDKSNRDSSSDSSCHAKNKQCRLRVKPTVKTANGVVYIEDSDWEIDSDDDDAMLQAAQSPSKDLMHPDIALLDTSAVASGATYENNSMAAHFCGKKLPKKRKSGHLCLLSRYLIFTSDCSRTWRRHSVKVRGTNFPEPPTPLLNVVPASSPCPASPAHVIDPVDYLFRPHKALVNRQTVTARDSIGHRSQFSPSPTVLHVPFLSFRRNSLTSRNIYATCEEISPLLSTNWLSLKPTNFHSWLAFPTTLVLLFRRRTGERGIALISVQEHRPPSFLYAISASSLSPNVSSEKKGFVPAISLSSPQPHGRFRTLRNRCGPEFYLPVCRQNFPQKSANRNNDSSCCLLCSVGGAAPATGPHCSVLWPKKQKKRPALRVIDLRRCLTSFPPSPDPYFHLLHFISQVTGFSIQRELPGLECSTLLEGDAVALAASPRSSRLLCGERRCLISYRGDCRSNPLQEQSPPHLPVSLPVPEVGNNNNNPHGRKLAEAAIDSRLFSICCSGSWDRQRFESLSYMNAYSAQSQSENESSKDSLLLPYCTYSALSGKVILALPICELLTVLEIPECGDALLNEIVLPNLTSCSRFRNSSSNPGTKCEPIFVIEDKLSKKVDIYDDDNGNLRVITATCTITENLDNCLVRKSTVIKPKNFVIFAETPSASYSVIWSVPFPIHFTLETFVSYMRAHFSSNLFIGSSIHIHIPSCLKYFFTNMIENCPTVGFQLTGSSQQVMPLSFDSSVQAIEDRSDCYCNSPCDVPVSPSIVDATIEEENSFEDTEILSSGDELDKFESDTDSQDTVIEGEAFKRMRSVAIKEKILHANEELFGAVQNVTYSAESLCINTNFKGQSLTAGDSQNFLPKGSTTQQGEQQMMHESNSHPKISDVMKLDLPWHSESEEFDETLLKFLSSRANILGNGGLDICQNQHSPHAVGQHEDQSDLLVNSKYRFILPCTQNPLKELYSSESSDNGSDAEEVLLSDTSTSSDEATYTAPAMGMYRYTVPISYKLHTIMEESCEESEKSSRGNTPTSIVSSDFVYYSGENAPIKDLKVTRNPKKVMHKFKPSLTSNKTFPENPDSRNKKDAVVNAALASTRLENYFRSTPQEKQFLFAEDDLTDESGGLSSDDDRPADAKGCKWYSKKNASNILHLGHRHSTSKSAAHTPVDMSAGETHTKQSKHCKSHGNKRDLSYSNHTETPKFKISLQSPLQSMSTQSPSPQKPDPATDKSEFNNANSNKCNRPLTNNCFRNTTNNENVSDDEAKYIMTHVIQHITHNNNESSSQNEQEVNDISPAIKILESEIARLMLTVSPVSLSAGEPSSSCSSTIGSNNSDYGSDTLESCEETTSDDDRHSEPNPHNSPQLPFPPHLDAENSASVNQRIPMHSENLPETSENTETVTDETLYICKQLVASLKKIADSTEANMVSDELSKAEADDNTAKQYIADQIVSLMQTVNASQNNSPLVGRSFPYYLTSVNLDSLNFQDRSDSDSPQPLDEKRGMFKNKTPSESGSETTISASISIPSYDDSDRTPTESEISHEMDELYALLETTGCSQDPHSFRFSYDCDSHGVDGRNTVDSPTSDDIDDFKRPNPRMYNKFTMGAESSLFGAASKLESLLPISIEERIARYNDAFLYKDNDEKESDSKDTQMRINVILPQPSSPYQTVLNDSRFMCGVGEQCSTNSLPQETSAYIPVINNTMEKPFNLCSRTFEEGGVTSVQIVANNFYQHVCLDKTAYSEQKGHSLDSLATYSTDSIDPDTTGSQDLECSTLSLETVRNEEGTTSIVSPLPKVINPKEKASSENDLLVANYRAKSKNSKVFGTKSAGNISELENIASKSTFRDTGYYSFKSSDESFLSLDDSTNSRTSTTSLTQYRSLTSTETIPEEEESSCKTASPSKISLSSGNIPFEVCDTSASKSSTLPLSLRGKISSVAGGSHRTRSSFFSTSGVLRKLTLLRDESGNSLRSSPHGRMRIRHRTLSGGSEDGRQKRDSLPQISVSECSQSSPSGTLSAANSERDSLGRQEDDTDQIFSYQSRSQMSLSSFGGRSESVTSVYSAAGGGRYGTVTVTGEVLFSLKYNYKGSVFEVHVKECHNLAPVDVKRNRSDPYVKVYLLPDRTKSGKRKTKVKKHTLNPVFDELLKFHVTFSELEKRVLWLTVWHSDRFGRNDFLGEVVLELEHDSFENGEMKCYPLQERTESFDTPVSYKGDIILALKYVPPDVTSRKPNKKHSGQAKGSLHVLVREARNLMATRSNGTSDPFCKSYLLPDKSKAGKQKTSVFKKTCSPKWNHTFVYDDVTVEDLKERCLELTIWDYDKITSNDFLGGVRLCLGTGKHQSRDVDWMDSSGEEVSLWYTMTERPNTWVDGSLLLRPSMQNRRLP